MKIINNYLRSVLKSCARALPNSIYWRLSPLFVKTAFGRVTEQSAKYYYDKWMKHLFYARKNGFSNKLFIFAEFGPGDSLGVGLCALLSGASRCYAFDVVRHATSEKNIDILNELVVLFRQNTTVEIDINEKGRSERVTVSPCGLIGKKELGIFIAGERVEAINKALVEGECNGIKISYIVPWKDFSLIEEGSVDFLISNAVMEHVDDLEFAYDACARWLIKGGCMSHGIDFRCHGTANRWNGHWSYSARQWEQLRGDRAYLLNRAPYSKHKEIIQSKGFQVITENLRMDYSGINEADLAEEFRVLSGKDLTISGALVQAVRL